MEAKSMVKLMDAGYWFVRPDDQPNIRIKYKKKDSGDWKTLEKFSTKVSRDKRLKEILNDVDYIIMD